MNVSTLHLKIKVTIIKLLWFLYPVTLNSYFWEPLQRELELEAGTSKESSRETVDVLCFWVVCTAPATFLSLLTLLWPVFASGIPNFYHCRRDQHNRGLCLVCWQWTLTL